MYAEIRDASSLTPRFWCFPPQARVLLKAPDIRDPVVAGGVQQDERRQHLGVGPSLRMDARIRQPDEHAGVPQRLKDQEMPGTGSRGLSSGSIRCLTGQGR